MGEANDLRLDDGFSTIITLSLAPTIKLYERNVTPPMVSGGGPIETTTMRNTAYRTQAPRKLKTFGQMKSEVAYATSAIPVVQGLIGQNQLITLTNPDGSTMEFWGWVEEFTPGTNTEGSQPIANITIQPSNRDADGAEVAPLYHSPIDSSGSFDS